MDEDAPKARADGENSWLVMDAGEHQPGRRPAEASGSSWKHISMFSLLRVIDDTIRRAAEAQLDLQGCSGRRFLPPTEKNLVEGNRLVDP